MKYRWNVLTTVFMLLALSLFILSWGSEEQSEDDQWENQGRIISSCFKSPSSRLFHSAVWTGEEMLIWGGWNGSDYFDDGEAYTLNDTWLPISNTGAPD